MKSIKKYTFFLCFIFLVNYTYSQDRIIKNYTVDNGLPSSEVYQTFQDYRGYIWFATDEGLSRYDGYSFKNYTNIEGLPDNTILEIYEDYKNRLWLISMSGKLSWIENDSVFVYKHNHLINGRLSGTRYPIKNSFYVDSLDNVYISFYGNDIFKISKNGKATEIKTDRLANIVKVINDEGVLCSSRNSDRLYIESKSAQFEFNINKKLSVNRTFAFKYNNTILYSDYNNLYVIDSNGRLKDYAFNNEILWISSDTKGQIWLGFLKDGVKVYKNFDFNNEELHLADGNSVSSVIFDNERGCWISTLENGVYYHPSLDVNNITKKDGLIDVNLNQLAIHNGSLYFGGNNHFLYEYNFSDVKLYDVSNGLKGKKCELIEWLGDTLAIGNSLAGTQLIYNNKVINYFSNCARHIARIDKDTIFLFYINKIRCSVNSKNVYYVEIPNVKKIHDVLKIDDETFLIGTDVGLLRFNYKTKAIRRDLSFLEFNNKIVCLYKTDESLWLGTKGAGLLRVKDEQLYQYSLKDGLPGNTIRSIVKEDSALLLGTNNGIVKLSFNSENQISNLILYNSGHGLITNGVKELAILNNKLFVATHKGLSIIDKDFEGKTSPLYITSCKVNSRDTSLKSYYEFDHDQNIIEFSFVTLNFRRNKPIKYLYKLEGLNENWQTTSDLTVRYDLLPPGDYTFKVKSINSYGLESDAPAQLIFKVKKAYYQTLGFKIAMGLVIVLIISSILLLIFRIKVNGIKNKNKLEFELNRFRQRALSAQMNPHFIYNSLNSVQSFILRNDAVKSSEYLSDFGKLMRRILENSQYSSISLSEELEALKLYVGLEQVRFKDGFKFLIKIDKGVNPDLIKVPPLILQPYVENAIHHGLRTKHGSKDLVVHIFNKAGKLNINIEDNGIGIKHSIKVGRNKKYRSFGTEITNKRLTIYGDLFKKEIKVNVIDISDIDELKTGTRIEIEFNQNT